MGRGAVCRGCLCDRIVRGARALLKESRHRLKRVEGTQCRLPAPYTLVWLQFILMPRRPTLSKLIGQLQLQLQLAFSRPSRAAAVPPCRGHARAPDKGSFIFSFGRISMPCHPAHLTTILCPAWQPISKRTSRLKSQPSTSHCKHHNLNTRSPLKLNTFSREIGVRKFSKSPVSALRRALIASSRLLRRRQGKRDIISCRLHYSN